MQKHHNHLVYLKIFDRIYFYIFQSLTRLDPEASKKFGTFLKLSTK